MARQFSPVKVSGYETFNLFSALVFNGGVPSNVRFSFIFVSRGFRSKAFHHQPDFIWAITLCVYTSCTCLFF